MNTRDMAPGSRINIRLAGTGPAGQDRGQAHVGNRYDIFGPSHAEETAQELGIPFLGRLPIDPEIARLSDAGLIEEYAADAFAPVVDGLADRVPEARPSMYLNV